MTELEPPRRFVWEAAAAGMTMVADHVVEAVQPNQSMARLVFTYSGWSSPLLGRLFGSITLRYLEQEAAALKLQAEGHASPGGA